jgi:DNA polymerase-3 subunit delta
MTRRCGRRGFGRGRFDAAGDLALAGDGRASCSRSWRGCRRRVEAIPVVRALQRRLLMLARLRARVERGEASTPS